VADDLVSSLAEFGLDFLNAGQVRVEGFGLGADELVFCVPMGLSSFVRRVTMWNWNQGNGSAVC